MAAEARPAPNDTDVAAALAEEVASDGGAVPLTVRALRDRFGRDRLTKPAREKIAGALERAGVRLEPGLDGAGLDAEVVLRLVGRGGAGHGDRRRRVLGVAGRVWKGTAAALGLLATVIGLYVFFEDRLAPAPPPARLAGDLNVAVAPFTSADDGRQGEDIARRLRATLGPDLARRTRASDVKVAIAPPPPVAPVRGATAAARVAAAERVAVKLNADVVVYGDVRDGPGRTVVAPSFYISTRALANAEELVGGERLGAAVVTTGSVSDNVFARVDLRRRLAARTRTLADFIVGLSHFAAGQDALAERWFRAAGGTPAAADAGVGEVIDLFRGHAAGRSGDLDGAERYYRSVLARDPAYARARFGLAEVRFQRASGGCERGRADPEGLAAADRGYRTAQAQAVAPYGPLLEERARFGRARVLLCLSQAGVAPRWDEAGALFRHVVAAHAAGEDRLRDEAAEALASLGLIALPARGAAGAGPQLRHAADFYGRAMALSRDPNRQALFSSLLGFIHGRLGDVAAGDRAYRRAAELTRDPADRRRYERARRGLAGGPDA